MCKCLYQHQRRLSRVAREISLCITGTMGSGHIMIWGLQLFSWKTCTLYQWLLVHWEVTQRNWLIRWQSWKCKHICSKRLHYWGEQEFSKKWWIWIKREEILGILLPSSIILTSKGNGVKAVNEFIKASWTKDSINK